MTDVSYIEACNVNQMVLDHAIQTISEQLFDDWVFENSNEGTFYSDYRFTEMSGDKYLIDLFHKHYDIKPEDQYWIGD